jgi:hypothetical protein
MLVLLKDGIQIGVFETYRELYLHIMHIENAKLLEDHPQYQFGEPQWSFSVNSPQQIAQQFHNREKQYDVSIMLEAFERKLNLLEICQGDYKKLTQVILTPDIDLESARQKWIDLYCEEHNFVVVDEE